MDACADGLIQCLCSKERNLMILMEGAFTTGKLIKWGTAPVSRAEMKVTLGVYFVERFIVHKGLDSPNSISESIGATATSRQS